MTAHNEKIETVVYKGKTYTGNHTQLCNRFKINRLTFASRLKVGWSIVEALGVKKRPVKRESGRTAKKLRKYFLYKHKPTKVNSEQSSISRRNSDGSINPDLPTTHI